MALAPTGFCWLVYCISIINILGIALALDRFSKRANILEELSAYLPWRFLHFGSEGERGA